MSSSTITTWAATVATSHRSPLNTLSSLKALASRVSPPGFTMSPIMGEVRSVEGWYPRPMWTRPVFPAMIPPEGMVTRQAIRRALPMRTRTGVVPIEKGKVRLAMRHFSREKDGEGGLRGYWLRNFYDGYQSDRVTRYFCVDVDREVVGDEVD